MINVIPGGVSKDTSAVPGVSPLMIDMGSECICAAINFVMHSMEVVSAIPFINTLQLSTGG